MNNPFRIKRPAPTKESIDDRYRAAIVADEDARGVVRWSMNARQWKRQRFWIRAQDAGLSPQRLVFIGYLRETGRISDDR